MHSLSGSCCKSHIVVPTDNASESDNKDINKMETTTKKIVYCGSHDGKFIFTDVEKGQCVEVTSQSQFHLAC